MTRAALALAVVVALAACAAPSTEPTIAATPTPPPTPTAAGATLGPTLGPTPTGMATDSPTLRPVAADPPPLGVELVSDGLVAPINVTAAGPGWLLVNERGGRVIAVATADGRTEVSLDLTDRVGAGGERGLLGLALHPGWPEVGRAFVHYTDLAGDTVVSEVAGAQAADAAPSFDRSTERVLLTADQPYANHNGGQLAFGPDGYLYIGLGDGGSAGDPLGHGQDTTTLLGSILRIDPDPPDEAPAPDSMPYGIPPGNPFADGVEGAPEILLYGLRNPWRFSFDRATGLLWIADVGQNAFEEVNRVDPIADAGSNLGWNVMEAAHCFAVPDCDSDGLTMPLAEYGRERGCSVTGGYVYRGEAIPDLRGWYVFGDYCAGTLFGLPSDAAAGAPLAPSDLGTTSLAISAFGEGADGELYVADLTGALYRVVAAP